MPTLIDWVYAASFIDGEGCISMFIAKGKRKNRVENKIYECPHLTVTIGHTNHEIINWFRDTFGGSVYGKFKNNQHPIHKTQLFWHLTKNQDKKTFLEGILPYLKLKKRQAELALEYISLEGQPNQEKRKKIVGECKELNHKGKSVETKRESPPSEDGVIVRTAQGCAEANRNV